MNKQEVIEKIKRGTEYFSDVNDYRRGFRDGLNHSLLVLRSLDEPEKPVVPQFVADWYEDHKGNLEYNLYLYQISIYDEKVEKDNFYYWMQKSNNPVHTLVNMHQFGYKIEKEKLYTVEIPSHSNPDHVVLRKYVNGKVCIDYYLFDDWRDYKCFQLTESEIKKDHNWAWKYAKEVEEVK